MTSSLSLSLSPALPESVVWVVDVDVDADASGSGCCVDDYDRGKRRVYVAEQFHDENDENHVQHDRRITTPIDQPPKPPTYTPFTPLPRLLPSSTSPTTPFSLLRCRRTRLASTSDDASYYADEEFYESDDERQPVSSRFLSLTATTLTTVAIAIAIPTPITASGVPNTPHTLPKRWPKQHNMPTLRGRRSSLSSKVHTPFHPPSVDDHSYSPDDALPHLPIPSLYTTATASSTEEDYTTGSEDLFASSPQSLRLHEHDSYLLDDDPDPFANYLSRARSSSSINSSHLDHTHHTHHTRPHTAQIYPLTTVAATAPTQPKPFLTFIPTFTSRARRRLSMTGPPTPNGSTRRQRLFTRPSLPSLVTLAQKLGTNLPTTNEDADPDFPVPLPLSSNSNSPPVRPRLHGTPVDSWEHPDGAVPPMYRSSPSLIGRGGRAMPVDTSTNIAYLPVGYDNSNASVNLYPYLPFPDDPNANVIRRPGATGSTSFSGSGHGDSSSNQQYQQNHAPNPNQYSYSPYSGGGMGGGGGTGGGRGGGGDRSDGDRGWRPRGQYKDYSSTDAHATTTEDEQGTHGKSGNGSGDSDDTPLARRLPSALTAQKSLRRQVKEDRDMQRRARARAKSAPRAQVPTTSTRLADRSGSGSGGLSVDELTRKLLKVQSSSPSPLPSPLNYEPSPAHSEQQHASTSTYHKYAFTATPPRPHWPEAYTVNRRGSESSDRHSHTSPVARPNTMGNTTAFPQFPSGPHPQQQQAHNLQRTKSFATAQSRPGSNIPSHEMPEQRQRADTLVPPLQGRQRANTLSSPPSSRPSMSSTATPPLPALIPPLPGAAHVPTLPGRGFAHAGEGGTTMLQRVFVGDMQRFSTVEIGHGTKARDVVAMIDERGELPRDAKAGGWMLFELSNDFGMERPIREFEPVMEVYNSWNTDARLNTFMLKKTPLATTLAPQNIPKASPKFGGYVEWEQKRGKWSKRWLELREHSLWVSKKEGAPSKDATLICSLSNFDAYLVTRIHKAPKPFTFSVKSVDNLNMFERAADYHHVFSCSVGDGLMWLEKILLARSHVLQQERAALFTNTQGSSSAPKSTSLSRAGTTKRGVPPNGPFLSFDLPRLPPIAPLIAPPETTVFEPGSLLARRMAGEK